MSRRASYNEKCDDVHLVLLLTLESILGIRRLFLGFSNSFELSRKGFALASGEVYFSLLLINLGVPWLQFLLFDFDLVVERAGFVCRRCFQS